MGLDDDRVELDDDRVELRGVRGWNIGRMTGWEEWEG